MSINLDYRLLESVFEFISNEVHILEAVRNENNIVIDFRYMAGSKTTSETNEDLRGKLVSLEYRSNNEIDLFHQFVKVIETGKPLDATFQDKEDRLKRWFRIKVKKFNDHLFIYREDVTMNKLAEEKIMQLNRTLFRKNRELEAISSELKTFTTIAANDYNETLKHLYGSMEFIANSDAENLSDAGKANIRRVQAAIQKMKLLTEDIIAFSKIHSDEQMASVDLNEVVANVLVGLVDKMKTENALVRTDKLPVITGYPPLVSLLFQNLVSNALKFRKKEIDPVIEITHSVQKGIDIEHEASVADLSYNVISVIDNGIGFGVDEDEKIFTTFYRLHQKGKQKGGVGLAICKKIMELHNGFITAERAAERTLFECYFPIQKNSPVI
jgi:signal transduction histidine kinase